VTSARTLASAACDGRAAADRGPAAQACDHRAPQLMPPRGERCRMVSHCTAGAGFGAPPVVGAISVGASQVGAAAWNQEKARVRGPSLPANGLEAVRPGRARASCGRRRCRW
jgi:hypothetical protein